LDEWTLCSSTQIMELLDGKITCRSFFPEEFGFKKALKSDLLGGDSHHNAKILLSILQGEEGPRRNVSVLNAALAIACSDKNVSVENGIRMAQESIDSGSAMHKLQALIDFDRTANS
jgi:anthranilate phosphoribosyltransferase